MSDAAAEPATFPRLLADVGGTSVRFAVQRTSGGPIADVEVFSTADHSSLELAAKTFLAKRPALQPAWAAIGIATAVTGDLVAMTNHPWSFSIASLKRELGLARLLVVNDFTTLAFALPVLRPQDLRQVGGLHAAPDAPMALLGPGTGLGVGGLLPAPDGRAPTAISGEGGHVTLSAADAAEASVVDYLRERFGHASAERALSGPGLVNLYDACCARAGHEAEMLDPADITTRALAAADPHCERAVGLFFSFLGSTAGNLALTTGARGGVYIGGGITPRLAPLIQRSALRPQFENKGRFKSYLEPIPLYVIESAFPPALTGAARALDLLP